MLVFRILRSNPHVLNYVLITGAVLGPVLAYAYTNSPSTEELDDALTRGKPNKQSEANKAKQVAAFLNQSRDGKEMDDVYSQLLRSGKSNATRHNDLQGTLAVSAAKDDPQMAQRQAKLTARSSSDGTVS